MYKPYFNKDCFSLFHGCCLDILKPFKENYVDMIFADPPYNLSNGGFAVKSGKRAAVHKGDWDQSSGASEDFEFHLDWIKACSRVLKPDGTVWISGTYHSIYQCGYALQKLGFRILNDISWFKPNAPPNIGCRCFAASHETLIWACKQTSKYTFNYKDMKYSDWKEDFIKKSEKQMRSVWAINTTPLSEKNRGKHPTQKPLKLLMRILKSCTKKGDLVLDPFTGSSTTGVASKLLDRAFIGIDNNSDYLDLSIKRTQESIPTNKQPELSP